MKTKHANKYVCNLLQKTKIRTEKKSNVKLTKQFNEKILIGNSYSQLPL